jgi:hypothetical protein
MRNMSQHPPPDHVRFAEALPVRPRASRRRCG